MPRNVTEVEVANKALRAHAVVVSVNCMGAIIQFSKDGLVTRLTHFC